MALSQELVNKLQVALASSGAAQELASLLATVVDGASAQDIGGEKTFTGYCDFGRHGETQGTALVAGDFALAAGFGDAATVTVLDGSTDVRGGITITSDGTGQGANPTVTLTFADGAWPAAPFVIVCRGAGDQPAVPFVVTSISTTAVVITFVGTPVAAETYTLYWRAIG